MGGRPSKRGMGTLRSYHPHVQYRPEPADSSQRPISMMTHSVPGKHPTFLRAGCDGKTSAWASAVTGSVALLVTAASSLLYFDNLYGPLGCYPHLLSTIALAGASSREPVGGGPRNRPAVVLSE